MLGVNRRHEAVMREWLRARLEDVSMLLSALLKSGITDGACRECCRGDVWWPVRE